MVSVPQISLIGATGPSENSAINFFNALPQQQTTLAGEVSKGLTAAAVIEAQKVKAQADAAEQKKIDELRDLQIQKAEMDVSGKTAANETMTEINSALDPNAKADILLSKGANLSAEELKKIVAQTMADPNLNPDKAASLGALTSRKLADKLVEETQDWDERVKDFSLQSGYPLDVPGTTVRASVKPNNDGTRSTVYEIVTPENNVISVKPNADNKDIFAEAIKRQSQAKEVEEVATLSGKVSTSATELQKSYQQIQNKLREINSGSLTAARKEEERTAVEADMAALKQNMMGLDESTKNFIRGVNPQQAYLETVSKVASGEVTPGSEETPVKGILAKVSNVNVRTTPNKKDNNKMMSILSANLVVTGEKDGWLKVYTPNGTQGWIEKSNATLSKVSDLAQSNIKVMSKQEYFSTFKTDTELDYETYLAGEMTNIPVQEKTVMD